MRALAEVFIHSTASEDVRFGWDGVDCARLDDLCDQFVIPGQRTTSNSQGLAARIAAYVVDLLLRNADGRWVYDEACRSAAVELPNGHRVFPAERVAQRIAVGHHYSVAEFYRATLAGDLLSYPHRQAG
jgi:hypothetical protein